MIASYNISTPRVYQSHTNMIFTNTLISCFTIFDPSNFSSQPLAAQKSSWLQVVMAGDHGLRTGNCQLTHLGNMEFSRSTFIWWWSTHLVKIKILYITHTKNEDPLSTLKGFPNLASKQPIWTSWEYPHEIGGHIPSFPGPVAHWRGCWVRQRLSGSRTSWDPGDFQRSRISPFNQWRSTTFAAKWHLTSLLNYVEKRVTWIGLSNRSYEPSSCIMDAASSLVKIWGPIAVTSPFH